MRDLTKYRLESSADRLKSAKLELDAGNFKDSINRSYYAIFHAIRALLAENEIGFKKHSAVMSYFRQHYIKTKIFDAKFSDYVGKAFTIRNFCDYADFVIMQIFSLCRVKKPKLNTIKQLNFLKPLNTTWKI